MKDPTRSKCSHCHPTILTGHVVDCYFKKIKFQQTKYPSLHFHTWLSGPCWSPRQPTAAHGRDARQAHPGQVATHTHTHLNRKPLEKASCGAAGGLCSASFVRSTSLSDLRRRHVSRLVWKQPSVSVVGFYTFSPHFPPRWCFPALLHLYSTPVPFQAFFQQMILTF